MKKKIIVPFDEEIINDLNNVNQDTKNINYDFDYFNIPQIKRKHNKNPKIKPVVTINFDLS